MRFAVDLAVFGAVYLLALSLFENTVAAFIAAFILAGAADFVLWDQKKL